MANEDQIEELKRIIEEEKQTKVINNRAKYKRWADRNQETLKQKRKDDSVKFRLKIAPQRRERRRKFKEELIALKGGKCVDCGGVFPPYAYDFHHLEGREVKLMSFMSMGPTKILAELNKCVLLCAICHRGRHVVDEEDSDAE